MNLTSNLAKSSLLASLIFWIIIGSDDYESNMLSFVMLSYIPIFICVLVVIVGTICPSFRAAKHAGFNFKTVFKTCFLYYYIAAFGACFFGIIASGFDLHIIAFCASAFITTSQSWIWFAKKQSQNTQQI